MSKYNKNGGGSKTNLHESNSIFAGRRTPTDKQLQEPEEVEELEDQHLEPLGGSEDDIDEFIKKHLETDDGKKGGAAQASASATAAGGDKGKSEEEKEALLAKAKELLGEDKMP